MATTPVTAPSTTPSTKKNQGANDALRGLDMDQFLKLMIAELQNQDPLKPMENSEILQQISQIRDIGATDKMTSTLDAVLLEQSLSAASALIGKQIHGLNDEAKEVTGKVDRITVTDGVPKLHVGTSSVDLKNIREILPDGSTASPAVASVLGGSNQ